MEWYSLRNSSLLKAASDYLDGKCKEKGFFRLSPTENLINAQSSIPASELRVSAAKDGGHFQKVKIANEGKLELAWLMSKLHDVSKQLNDVHKPLGPHIGPCSGALMGNVAMLLGPINDEDVPFNECAISSESELRLAIGDPIMRMICMCWGYQVTYCTLI